MNLKRKARKSQKTLTDFDRDPLVEIMKGILNLNILIQQFNETATDDPELQQVANRSKGISIDALRRIDSIQHAASINGVLRCFDKEWPTFLYVLHGISDLMNTDAIYESDKEYGQ